MNFDCSGLGEYSGVPFGIAVADYNEDGWPDLAVANAPVGVYSCSPGGQPSVTIFTNTGDWGDTEDGFTLTDLSICDDCGPAEVAFADMNDDELLDLVVSATDGDPGYGTWGVYVSFQNESHQFSSFTAYENPVDHAQSPVRGLVASDFNNDGLPDVAVTGDMCWDEQNDKVYVFGNTNGVLSREDLDDLGLTEEQAVGHDLVAGDFITGPSGGLPDLITCNMLETSELSVLRNNGGFDFDVYPYDDPCESGWGNFADVVAGHINPGTALDVALVNRGGEEVRVHYGDNTGDFTHNCADHESGGDRYVVAPGWCCGSPVYDQHAGIALGDINADNKLDLVVCGPAGTSKIAMLLGKSAMTSPGKFQFNNDDEDYYVSLIPSEGSAELPVRVVIADFDDDGKMDIVTTNHLSNNISVLIQE